MWTEILTAFLFFLPAGLANGIPVIVAKAPLLKKWEFPMDFNKSWRGIRLLGDHKTMRGLVTGILMAILTAGLLQLWYLNDASLRANMNFNYANVNYIVFGFISGLGALLGDAFKSFLKRRTSIKPGAAWFPFDQIDYIIGGCLLTALYVRLNLLSYLLVFILYFGLHMLSTYVGFLLKFKKQPI